MAKKRIGDLLYGMGMITSQQLEDVLQTQLETKERLGEIIIGKGYVTEEQMIEVLEFQLGIPHVNLYRLKLDPVIVHTLPESLARKYLAIAIKRANQELTVAMSNPLDAYAIEHMRMSTGFTIRPAIAVKAEICSFIDHYYGRHGSIGPLQVQALKMGKVKTDTTDEDSAVDIMKLLEKAKQMNASDLHISVNCVPVFRVNGELIKDGEILQPEDAEAMGRRLMTESQWADFCLHGEIDYSFSAPGTSRFRINTYRQQGYVSIAARVVSNAVPEFHSLGIPEVLRSLTEKPHGLVLVTGPTGSGKSTTLAALVDHINRTQRRHIITLEDPIEYLHHHDQSIIEQREIGVDTKDFSSALRSALRQDPDVIFVGELRDLETISTALTAAETGHLVFATLHTSDSVSTVDRIIDVFPANQQQQVRIQIASVLQGIATQRLYKTVDGTRRVAAVEVLINTPAVANLIRSEKTHQIRSVMQTGRAFGMQTMEEHLCELYRRGLISPAVV